jgi:hypothetical protein
MLILIVDEIYDPELQRQLKQIQERLKQSLIDLEEKTEQKIQAYHKEQEILLIQEKEKAIYDGAILWQTMKEVSKTIYAEEQRAYRLSCNKTSTDQVILDRVKRVEQRNHAIEDGSQDALEIRESHVHFAHESAFLDDHPLQRRRSSAFKRDLFGGLAPTAYNNNRRSSYVLDESAIANSFKNSEPMPQQFHRRRSSLVPSNAMPRHHLSHLHPFVKHNNAKSNSSSSWEDAEEDIGSKSNNKSKELNDDDNEDLFPLDEDVESLINYTYGSEERRPSSKYIEFDDDEEEDLTRVRLGEGMQILTALKNLHGIT